MPISFNNQLRQITLLIIIVFLAIILIENLYVFLPGFLGAVTLYILLRERYFNLIFNKKWNKTATALMFVLISFILIGLPVFFSIELLAIKVADIVNNPAEIMVNGKIITKKLEELTGYQLLTDKNLQALQQKITVIIPSLLNSTANVLSNFAIMFFVLYYLLKGGADAEKRMAKFIPLKEENIQLLSSETKNMVKANAIGIPILAVIQGIVAAIGYTIFGVHDVVLWGFLTGICSMIPIVGTGIIWVPLTAFLFSTNNNFGAVGLLIYSLVILTNIDYVARITLLKKLIDVHPLLTVFGVIIGISLFGFWGVIFGPLLISYLIILIKIYINEFVLPTINPNA